MFAVESVWEHPLFVAIAAPLAVALVGLVFTAIGRSLTWEKDDITLQNIQARVRAPSIWMLANLRASVPTKPTFTQTLTAQYRAMTYVYQEAPPAPAKPAGRR